MVLSLGSVYEICIFAMKMIFPARYARAFAAREAVTAGEHFD